MQPSIDGSIVFRTCIRRRLLLLLGVAHHQDLESTAILSSVSQSLFLRGLPCVDKAGRSPRVLPVWRVWVLDCFVLSPHNCFFLCIIFYLLLSTFLVLLQQHVRAIQPVARLSQCDIKLFDLLCVKAFNGVMKLKSKGCLLYVECGRREITA
jgi:hypothetical protein